MTLPSAIGNKTIMGVGHKKPNKKNAPTNEGAFMNFFMCLLK